MAVAAVNIEASNMSMPTKIILASVVVLTGLAILAIPQVRKSLSRFLSVTGPNAGDHADARLPKINAALSAAKPGFIFLAGDSHAELLGEATLCGLPVVNGGSHGANAKVYVSLLNALDFKATPAAVVLLIGTNDIFVKNQPAEPRNLAEKIARVDTIAKSLTKISPQLVMTPLPPIAPRTTRILDLTALVALSQEQKWLCEQNPACQFVDPFRDMRDRVFGLARSGATADGLHSSDYGKVRQALEAAICPPPIVTSGNAGAPRPLKLR